MWSREQHCYQSGTAPLIVAWFSDRRAPELVEQEMATLVRKRVFGIALGYRDLVDHDELRLLLHLFS
jgi:hypothetical protein